MGCLISLLFPQGEKWGRGANSLPLIPLTEKSPSFGWGFLKLLIHQGRNQWPVTAYQIMSAAVITVPIQMTTSIRQGCVSFSQNLNF
jgi:hypothetical protein